MKIRTLSVILSTLKNKLRQNRIYLDTENLLTKYGPKERRMPKAADPLLGAAGGHYHMFVKIYETSGLGNNILIFVDKCERPEDDVF